MKREKKISLKYKKVKFSGATRLMNWSRAQPSGCKTKIRLDVFTGCPIITVPHLKSSSFGTALVRHTCSPHLTRMWLCHPPTSFLSNLSLVSSIKVFLCINWGLISRSPESKTYLDNHCAQAAMQ